MKIVKILLVTLIVFLFGSNTLVAQSKQNANKSTHVVKKNKKNNKKNNKSKVNNNASRKRGSAEVLVNPKAKTMNDKKEAKRQRQARIDDVIEKNERRKKKKTQGLREGKVEGKKKTKTDN